MLRTYVIQIPSICLAEFWHLNAWENGRYRMASKTHFWWLRKKHTYLVTVHFPVETLGIGDIQLKKQKQKTYKQTKSISKLVNVHIQTQV